MIAIAFTILFIASGMLAVAVCANGLGNIASAFSRISRELREAGDFREVTFRKVDVQVSASARVLRPDFTAARRLPQPEDGLTAAA